MKLATRHSLRCIGGQVQWIGAALQATNSTLGLAARPGALLPAEVPGKEWLDYRPGDAGFHTAAALAVVGAATPAPGTGQVFHPQQHISSSDLELWVHSAASLLPASLANPQGINRLVNNGGEDTSEMLVSPSRSQAATIIAGALLGGPILPET